MQTLAQDEEHELKMDDKKQFKRKGIASRGCRGAVKGPVRGRKLARPDGMREPASRLRLKLLRSLSVS